MLKMLRKSLDSNTTNGSSLENYLIFLSRIFMHDRHRENIGLHLMSLCRKIVTGKVIFNTAKLC
jgi:hypothetical protein